MAIPLAAVTAAAACRDAPRPPRPEAADPVGPVPFAPALQTALRGALESRDGHDLGISAAVLVPGYALWSGAAGSSHAGVPMTPDMLFEVGSVAKNVEAALVLRLAEEGALALDDPVARWLPPLPHVDSAITVRQLLDHTSGVFNVFESPDFPWIGADVDHGRQWSLAETFARFVRAPYGSPGAVQHYASTNYLLLTAIAERATGKSVPELAEGRLFRPLGLRQTWMSMGDPPPERFAVAHPFADDDGDGALEDLAGRPRTWIASLTHPLLFTTPSDLVRWLGALYHDRVVLEPASLDAMLTWPVVATPDPEGGRYGLGVVDYTAILGTRAIGHAGSSPGYSAAALYLPDYQVALAWAINTGESPPELAGAMMAAAWRDLSTVLLHYLAPAHR